MRHKNRWVVIAALATTSACYHATQLAATWSEPGASVNHFQKTVTVFATNDQSIRRSVEERLATDFGNAIPSYRVIPSQDVTAKNPEVLQELRTAGFDGAVIMRVVDVTTETTYVPGAYWYSSPYTFNGYWSAAWAYPYDPGYYVQDKLVSVETEVYSLAQDKLVYAARSETVNPKSAGKLTDSVVRHVREDMQKRGLLGMYDFAPARHTGNGNN